MPVTRIDIRDIQSYLPLMDMRKTGKVGVLSGSNFSFSISGLQSDFASRLIAGGQQIGISDLPVQSYRVGNEYHIFTGNTVWGYENVDSTPGKEYTGVFSQIATLPPLQTADLRLVPEERLQITSAYLGGNSYLCSWNHGVYRISGNTYTRLTNLTTPGFPDDSDPVLFICETNARMIYVTAQAVYWSATGEPENLVPSLGGAGLQVLPELVSGKLVAVTSLETGLIVWTENGTLAGEFIGSDLVFRWYRLDSTVIPLGQSAVAKLSDGSVAFLAGTGVYSLSGIQVPQPLTPIFNEYLRDFMLGRDTTLAYLWSDHETSRLFVSTREKKSMHVQTFVLETTLDKWGVLSRSHLGLFRYSTRRGAFAMCDSNGIASYFLQAGYGNTGVELSASPGVIVPLNSKVVIGYIREEGMVPEADTLQEVTKVVVHATARETSNFIEDEGFLLSGTILSESVTDEGVLPAVAPVYEDEGLLNSLPTNSDYSLTVISDTLSLDQETGINYGRTQCHVASKNSLNTVWVANSQSQYAQLEFSAPNVGDLFIINAIDITLAYAGQVTGG